MAADAKPLKFKVGKGCARSVLLTFASGYTRRLLVDCDRWGCQRCAEKKIDELVLHLKYVSDGVALFAAEVDADHWEAARAMARRKSAGYLGIKRLDDDVLLVSDQQLAGRRWALEPIHEVKDAALSLAIRRVDWCSAWRPEKDERPKEPVVGRLSIPVAMAQRVLDRAGFDAAIGSVPAESPEQAAERLSLAWDAIRGAR